MKIIITLGTGNSGAGAVNDYLLSRNDFQNLFGKKEFRLVNDPDGIDELYNLLYYNFSVNGSAIKLNNFRDFTKNLFKSRYNKNNNIYNKNLIDLSEKFINDISKINYNGAPRFYLDKMSKIEKIKFYFNRFFLKKNVKDIKLLNMALPCTEENFLKFSEEFINNIFRSYKFFDEKKNIAIEQGGNFLNPLSSTKYYGKDRKVILVTRNPKAIFWSMKRGNSFSYPGNNVEIFVDWYKEIMQKINKKEFNEIIKIKFEHFFENFKEESLKLCDQLGIDKNVNSDFDLNYTLKNLYKYRKNLSKYEIEYIDKNLGELN